MRVFLEPTFRRRKLAVGCYHFYTVQQRPVVRKVDSGIHWIVIFQLLQKGIESNETRDIELSKDKSDLNSKTLNFNITKELTFAGINMFLARLRIILARA